MSTANTQHYRIEIRGIDNKPMGIVPYDGGWDIRRHTDRVCEQARGKDVFQANLFLLQGDRCLHEEYFSFNIETKGCCCCTNDSSSEFKTALFSKIKSVSAKTLGPSSPKKSPINEECDGYSAKSSGLGPQSYGTVSMNSRPNGGAIAIPGNGPISPPEMGRSIPKKYSSLNDVPAAGGKTPSRGNSALDGSQTPSAKKGYSGLEETRGIFKLEK